MYKLFIMEFMIWNVQLQMRGLSASSGKAEVGMTKKGGGFQKILRDAHL
jgi:hypothetical protein